MRSRGSSSRAAHLVAMEGHCESQREQVLGLFRDRLLWSRRWSSQFILDRLMQRYALPGTDLDFAACSELLDLAPDLKHRSLLMGGLRRALAGKASTVLPDRLQKQLEAHRLRRGNPICLFVCDQEMRRHSRSRWSGVGEKSTPIEERLELIELLGQTRPLRLSRSCRSYLVRLRPLPCNELPCKPLRITTIQRLANPCVTSYTASYRQQTMSSGRPSAFWRPRCMVPSAPRRKSNLPASSQPSCPPISCSNCGCTKMKTASPFPEIWGRTRQTPDELNAQIESVRRIVIEQAGNPRRGNFCSNRSAVPAIPFLAKGDKQGPT